MFSSGMAAIFTLLLHIHPKRVVVEGGYHGTHKAIALCARQVGSTTYFKGPEPLSSQPQEGDLWWLEVPRNATCEVVDIAAYVSPEFLYVHFLPSCCRLQSPFYRPHLSSG
jgi:cystathionine beta-lyase/cystathionine gamma-synthase